MAEHRDSKEQAKEKKIIIGSFFLVLLSVIGLTIFLLPGRGVGYTPAQPIPFSHKAHAGIRKIQCLYCHSNADKSPHANVPSTAVCMNCHRVVLSDRPNIKKIWESFEQNKPIQWVNVHVLPDFVYFNHSRHVQKGVSCEACHGNVANMETVEQVSPLTMGWCVNCHRQPQYQAPLNCNTCHR